MLLIDQTDLILWHVIFDPYNNNFDTMDITYRILHQTTEKFKCFLKFLLLLLLCYLDNCIFPPCYFTNWNAVSLLPFHTQVKIIATGRFGHINNTKMNTEKVTY